MVNTLVTKLNRVVFYCSDELLEKLEALAKEDNRSLSNLICTLLSRIIEGKTQGKI